MRSSKVWRLAIRARGSSLRTARMNSSGCSIKSKPAAVSIDRLHLTATPASLRSADQLETVLSLAPITCPQDAIGLPPAPASAAASTALERRAFKLDRRASLTLLHQIFLKIATRSSARCASGQLPPSGRDKASTHRRDD